MLNNDLCTQKKRIKEEAWNPNTGGRTPTNYGSVGAASPIQ